MADCFNRQAIFVVPVNDRMRAGNLGYVSSTGNHTRNTLDMASIEKAKGWISDLTELPEVGKVYQGTIKAIKEFGAFVEFIPGTEGLVHISEWDWAHVPELSRIAKEGDRVEVKLIEVDQRTGKFRLSRKALLPETARAPREPSAAGDQGDHGGHGDHGGAPRHDRPRRDGGHRREGHGR